MHPLGDVVALELAEREALALAQAVRALVDEQQVAAAGGIQRRELGGKIMLGVAVVAVAEDYRGVGVGHAVEPRVQTRAIERGEKHILVRLLLHGSDAGAHTRERRPARLGVGRPVLLAQDVLLPRGLRVRALRRTAERLCQHALLNVPHEQPHQRRQHRRAQQAQQHDPDGLHARSSGAAHRSSTIFCASSSPALAGTHGSEPGTLRRPGGGAHNAAGVMAGSGLNTTAWCVMPALRSSRRMTRANGQPLV